MSAFLGLHTGLTGVRAAQLGLDTASHNVANANTPGHTRQRTVQSSRGPVQVQNVPVGAGVKVTGVERMRDGFLDTRVRSVAATFESADARAELLQRTESVLAEPTSGVTGLLGGVFDAFDDLALSPRDPASRAQVLTSLDALASRFNAVDTGWTQLATDTTERADFAIADANTDLARIAEINRTLAGFGTSQLPNDLLDERDVLADQLAGAIGASVLTTPDHMMAVTLDGQTLVVAGPPSTAESLSRAGTALQVDGAPPTPITARGEVGALLDFVATDLPTIRGDFDQLAQDVATALNTQHAAGRDLAGNPGGALLTGTTAGTLSLAAGLTGDTVAAAEAGRGPFDGGNAQAIADLREGVLDESARGFAVGLGQVVSAATGAADAEEALMVGARTARRSAHSVSLDEEMVSLVQHQRALEASARVMTAVDEALATLVSRVGVVGR